MKIVSQLNNEGYFLGPTTADESPLEPGVFLIPGLAIDVEPPVIPAGKLAKWKNGSWVFEDVATPPAPPEPPVLTPKEKDEIRFMRRASARDRIVAEFAAENMERIRNGVWTVPQLISLTQDTGLKALLDNINTLSFEIAASMLPGLTNSLLTTEIKAAWVAKLQAHFYN